MREARQLVEFIILLGDLSLTTLRVVVVEEHHTLVTGNEASTLTKFTQELKFFDITNTYPDPLS